MSDTKYLTAADLGALCEHDVPDKTPCDRCITGAVRHEFERAEKAHASGERKGLVRAAKRMERLVCRQCRKGPDECNRGGERTKHATCLRIAKEARIIRALEVGE